MGRRPPLLVLVLVAVVVGLAARPVSAAATNDPRIDSQWGLADIKAPEAWAKGKAGGVRIAVVSTGVANHPDLAGRTEGGFDGTNTSVSSDSSGRGTHLAGIVGAATDNGVGIAGVARDARILPFKAFRSESSVDDESFVRALVEVQNAKPQVALVDLPDSYAPDPRVLQALKNLGDVGISVAVGAGGAALGGLPVLAVTGTTEGGGRVGGGVGPQGVAAPGGGILSTTVSQLVPAVEPTYDYGEQSGTSQAAAHVAGALAILRGLGASSGQAADLLRSTARKGSDAFGAGRIDVAAAANAYRAPVATTTTTKKAAVPTTAKIPTFPGGTIPKATPAPAAPGGPAFDGELAEPGEEDAILPSGAEDFLDSGETGGATSTVGEGDDRPLGLLAVGFGLLFGVGSGLSVTFRRLADAPL